ncbi:hypothetical protein FDI95_gp306 [Citrobacter phage CF1 ERZ-2017]|uniref:Trimeric autotransporter adhesin YadA-like C-terminal membrane anchor domain-containing protein n=1 Tax=Citrobacter phage CF1 ERZ-2017 TaxID=2267236 RepID=A0A2H4YFT7_9CAUD|nr:hypothetical protein FDI95_gp306 [Citrobacter phage CF1 ERZ-2017]AUE23027.1 hypothetical protein Cf1_00160 [Citrobacter phage CF1 ERZ-2017]
MIKRTIAVIAIALSSMTAHAMFEISPEAIEAAEKAEKIRNSDEYKLTTHDVYTRTDDRIQKAEQKAAAGIAGVAAMTNIPTVPGHEVSLGVAFGGYDGEKALAAGLNFTPNDAPTSFKVSIAATSEEVVYGGGLGFGF